MRVVRGGESLGQSILVTAYGRKMRRYARVILETAQIAQSQSIYAVVIFSLRVPQVGKAHPGVSYERAHHVRYIMFEGFVYILRKKEIRIIEILNR